MGREGGVKWGVWDSLAVAVAAAVAVVVVVVAAVAAVGAVGAVVAVAVVVVVVVVVGVLVELKIKRGGDYLSRGSDRGIRTSGAKAQKG